MERYVSWQLRTVFTMLAVAVVGTAVTAAVRGLPPVSAGGGMFVAVVVALQVLRLLRLLLPVRQSWLVRKLDDAAALPDKSPVDDGSALRRRPVLPDMFLSFLVIFLAPALLWWPWWCAVVPFWLTVDWLGEAVLIALWERRSGKNLWRGKNSADLYVTPRPPTPAATDAPPT
ncbi:hypothetical protein [Streptomyces minutiscleroticus]|nr:hypothetical protein [Streptomyces minutiscleroticus]